MSETITITRATSGYFVIDEVRGTKAEGGGDHRPICFRNTNALVAYVKVWCEEKPF